ncbi:hypothetical protein J6590_015301 [Homalodisca vitripennis]|nr:hypothetical protein J6590_015301 [Homalodisca vitripennis]
MSQLYVIKTCTRHRDCQDVNNAHTDTTTPNSPNWNTDLGSTPLGIARSFGHLRQIPSPPERDRARDRDNGRQRPDGHYFWRNFHTSKKSQRRGALEPRDSGSPGVPRAQELPESVNKMLIIPSGSFQTSENHKGQEP